MSSEIFIPDKKAKQLFDKYAFPMMKACKTDFQRQNARGIAIILWALLVTNTDTEEKVYKALDSVLHNHENCISFGVLYYHKMKKSLTNKQKNYLTSYYLDRKKLDYLISDDSGDIIVKF